MASTLKVKLESWMFDDEGKMITTEEEWFKAMNEHFREQYAGLSRPLFGMEIMDLPDPRWALENLIQEEGITMIHGSPGSGKSLMAMDWAYVLAHPQLESWMGQKRLKQFKPMYIFTEGFAGLRPRSEAWAMERGASIPDPGVMWIRDAVRLNRTDDPDRPWTDQVAKLYQLYQEHERDILFVDTLANTFAGNENSQQDANNYLAALRMFQAHGPVVVVHHNTKDSKDFRGSTVFEGAVDTKVAVEEKAGIVHLYITKQKDGDPGFYLDMRLKPYVVKETPEYDITSVVLEQRAAEPKIPTPTKKQQEILELLAEGPMSTAVIAHQRDASLESTSNMLNRMAESGFVEQDDETLAWSAAEVEEL